MSLSPFAFVALVVEFEIEIALKFEDFIFVTVTDPRIWDTQIYVIESVYRNLSIPVPWHTSVWDIQICL